MAFVHHAAACTGRSARRSRALLRPPLSVAQTRRLLITDLVLGLSAAVVLIAGLLRVWYCDGFMARGSGYRP